MLMDIGTTVDESITALLSDGLSSAEQQIKNQGVAEQLRTCRQAAFPMSVLAKGLRPRLHQASASKESDRVHILNSIIGKEAAGLDDEPEAFHPAYDKINRALGGLFARAGFERALKERPAEFQDICEAMREAVDTRSLEFDLRAVNGTDADLAAIGSSLPPTLERLVVNCAGLEVSDRGLAALAANLPETLEHLHLKFNNCKKVGDGGVAALGANLPATLEHLHLIFWMCEKVGDGGVAALAANLPAKLVHLHLYFTWCEKLGDEGVAALATNLPQTLEHLHLYFNGCEKVGDGGVAALAASLPEKLEHLSINFFGCEKVGDGGVAALAANLPATLEHLDLDFMHCEKVGDGGVAALAAKLPATLQRLKIDCYDTKVSDPVEQLLRDKGVDSVREWGVRQSGTEAAQWSTAAAAAAAAPSRPAAQAREAITLETQA